MHCLVFTDTDLYSLTKGKAYLANQRWRRTTCLRDQCYDVGCHTPASNLGYLAPPPGQFFMGAKLFIGTPWMGNEGVLKKILVWAM